MWCSPMSWKNYFKLQNDSFYDDPFRLMFEFEFNQLKKKYLSIIHFWPGFIAGNIKWNPHMDLSTWRKSCIIPACCFSICKIFLLDNPNSFRLDLLTEHVCNCWKTYYRFIMARSRKCPWYVNNKTLHRLEIL